MKSKLIYYVIILVLVCGPINSRCDEGMWLVNLIEKLNMSQMQSLGFQLTAEDIYSLNNASIKDAVVLFGGYCTASIISPDGLLFTNHHCGIYSVIDISTPENDYSTVGYSAKTRAEELSTKNLYVKFLVRIDDVTDEILSRLDSEMKETERIDVVRKVSEEIKSKAVEGTHYQAEIKEFFHGLQYFLFIYETFEDIRVVYVPPSSIGYFGGETDNWQWPRHTGDFALFRVYSSPDGTPAKYSINNIPLKAKKWLPISLNGYTEGDFAMIIGYPGRTQRYITSHIIHSNLKTINPVRIKIKEEKLNILKNDMEKCEKTKLAYSQKILSASNFYKYFIGQNLAFETWNVVERKRKNEDIFKLWAKNSDEFEYEKVVTDLMILNEELSGFLYVFIFLREALLRGSEVINFALKFRDLHDELIKKEKNTQKLEQIITQLKAHSEVFFNKFIKETEYKLFISMLKLTYDNIDKISHPEGFAMIEQKFKNDFALYADKVFNTSIFTDYSRCKKFLNNPKLNKIEKDILFSFALSVDNLNKQLMADIRNLNIQMGKAMRLYMTGIKEMQPENIFYPDANQTMRLTYGKIKGYYLSDTIKRDYITYIDGIIEKENPNDPEFIVPEKLKELYLQKNYGIYSDLTGNVPVCFIAGLDIIGGSSGSPVLNAKGEIIGITFDGNWEGLTMDVLYEPEIQRAINVDIRFVLFIIDKFAGASYLLDEMTIRMN